VAINPSSDLVLGAVLAADPTRYRAAAQRLQRLGGMEGAEAAAGAASPWQATATAAGDPPAPAPSPAPGRAMADQPAGLPRSAAARAGKAPDAFAKLEAFVLQTFIQTMLPANSAALFGKGTAGEVWKSMLAEKLGDELARSNQIGLAKRLAAGRIGAMSGAAAAAPGGAALSPALISALPYLQGALASEADAGAASAPMPIPPALGAGKAQDDVEG
jgi:hypothetical protein